MLANISQYRDTKDTLMAIHLVGFSTFSKEVTNARVSYEGAVEDEKQAKVKQVLALVLQKEEEAQELEPVIKKAQEDALEHLKSFEESSRYALMISEKLHKRCEEIQAGAEVIPLREVESAPQTLQKEVSNSIPPTFDMLETLKQYWETRA